MTTYFTFESIVTLDRQLQKEAFILEIAVAPSRNGGFMD
jgi:hypothetical protein